MDSLLCKMGSLRALMPPNSKQESPVPSSSMTASGRSQRSSSLQLKSSTAMISNAPLSTDEAPSSASPPPFNPLPLPPPPTSAVPSPLKFLWFTQKKQGQAAENESADIVSPMLQEPGEAFAFLDDHSSDAPQSDAQGDISDGPPSDRVPADGKSGDGRVTESNSIPNPIKSWVSRLMGVKTFWASSREQNETAQLPPFHSPASEGEGEQLAEPESSSPATCGLDCGPSGCLDVPYMRVLHSKESFSKFLQDASLSDMKTISQMSFLCDMAYMIPDIQPGQLLKYHHLRYVTSSLDKKAEAAAKTKDCEGAKKSDQLENHHFNGPDRATTSEGSDSNPSLGSPLSMKAQTLLGQASEKDDGDINATASSECDNTGATNQADSTLPHAQERAEHAESLMGLAPVTAVVVAEEETEHSVAHNSHSSHHSCPSEWYICDEDSSHTRFFVIQGSESLASWQANLFFEPTTFEGLNVLVHRGIYEAANALYEQVLPEVLAHFKAHGHLTQVRLTGHSLGGSLATLLALMFQIRQVLPRSAILPVITFGSPCIMCGGDYLLRKLNLPANHIQSIVMHRDIVPRAFACEYPDHVAEVLKRLNGKFRDHPCLNHQKLLYAPMGQLLILQPDENRSPSHPLLPIGHGLYLLRHPINGDDLENATQLRAAQRAFLNMPHPLETLSDPGAYGFDGAISRDHDPRSYAKAANVVLHHEVRRLRCIQREQRRQLWWPLVIAESSKFMRKDLEGKPSTYQTKSNVGVRSVMSKSLLVAKHPALNNQSSFTSKSMSVWGSMRDSFSRSGRIIASQHVQVGMVLILSVRMVIVKCLTTLFAWA